VITPVHASQAEVVHFPPTKMEVNTGVASTTRFRWGLVLAWIPLLFFIIPTAIGVIASFAQMSNQRATGLGAVAGGLAEIVVTFGFVVIVASEIAAIVMLLRTFSRSHPIRAVVAIISVCCSGLLLFLMGLFFWVTTVHR